MDIQHSEHKAKKNKQTNKHPSIKETEVLHLIA